MKISWPVSLTWRVCHLWPTSLIRQLCLLLILLPTSLIGFQLQFLMMTVRMKINLYLLMFLQFHQHQYFLNGSVQHVKQLVILPVILEINVEHVLSFTKLLLFWPSFWESWSRNFCRSFRKSRLGCSYGWRTSFLNDKRYLGSCSSSKRKKTC